jgi:hypothetical protein
VQATFDTFLDALDTSVDANADGLGGVAAFLQLGALDDSAALSASRAVTGTSTTSAGYALLVQALGSVPLCTNRDLLGRATIQFTVALYHSSVGSQLVNARRSLLSMVLQADANVVESPSLPATRTRKIGMVGFNEILGGVLVRQVRSNRITSCEVRHAHLLPQCQRASDVTVLAAPSADSKRLSDRGTDSFGHDPAWMPTSDLAVPSLQDFAGLYYNASTDLHPSGIPFAFITSPRTRFQPPGFSLLFSSELSTTRCRYLLEYLRDARFIDPLTSVLSVKVATLNEKMAVFGVFTATFHRTAWGTFQGTLVPAQLPFRLHKMDREGLARLVYDAMLLIATSVFLCTVGYPLMRPLLASLYHRLAAFRARICKHVRPISELCVLECAYSPCRESVGHNRIHSVLYFWR